MKFDRPSLTLKRVVFLIFSFVLFFLALIVFFFVDPEMVYFHISQVPLLLLSLLIFLWAFCLGMFLFERITLAVLLGLFFIANIVLRYLGFKDIIYFFILLLLFLLMGALFQGRRQRSSLRRLTE